MDGEHSPLIRFSRNVFSQNGEDGVVEEILRSLNLLENPGWCVEFGAWDGKFFSNTFRLVKDFSYSAVYVEADEEKFEDLLKTASQFPRIIPLQARIHHLPNHESSLDEILSKTPIPKEFAVLSIDIDSFDLEIWQSLQRYNPVIVIIEINSSVPPGIIWWNSQKTPGNTFSATLMVGESKNYQLVCHTGNLIFVRSDAFETLRKIYNFPPFPEQLFLFSSEWMKNESDPNIQIRELKRVLKEWIASKIPLTRFIKRIQKSRILD